MPRQKKKGAEMTQMRLPKDTRWVMKELGDGDRTAGAELIGKMTRLLAHAHTELDGGTPPQQAIADQIKELRIPEIYADAQIELITVKDGDGNAIAWII